MDPTALISNGSFQSANPSSSPYHLSEILPFSINGGGLDLRRVQNREGSGNDPTVLDQRATNNDGARKRRYSAPKEDDSAKNDCDGKRFKSSDNNCDSKMEDEPNSRKPEDQNSKPSEMPKPDYIHVRARRGQATDSHSLAERARREKIGERMKTLQDLVPGCNKVIGKALVLDEIINYVQSLQRQVEFLSMKLEAVNSRTSPDIEGFPSKDFGHQTFDTAGAAFGSQASRHYSKGLLPEWLHMQIGGGFQRTT